MTNASWQKKLAREIQRAAEDDGQKRPSYMRCLRLAEASGGCTIADRTVFATRLYFEHKASLVAP